MEVTVSGNGPSRTYEFDSAITQNQLKWVGENRHIDSFQVSGRKLTVTKKEGTDWSTLEADFIMPGLYKTFGSSLKVNTYASSR